MTSTREELDTLMTTTLEMYQDRINAKLRQFGASFNIGRMKPNYQGSGEPRLEYVLQVRQRDLPLGSRKDGDPYFGSVLSEGDKRTLAFAFFLARLEAASVDMADKIIVLDDPVSSLDTNRRMQTVNVITSLTKQCSQVVVLSHDPYFIRQVRDQVGKVIPDSAEPRILCINRAPQDYSVFSDCDIDWICASDYYRHHQLVSDYVNGTCSSDIRDVAKVLRPLIEGFYHRRYPGLLPRRVTMLKES